MQVFALGILVVQIAERDRVPQLAPLYLGLTGLARAIPGLAFTLIAGAMADRVDRRRILFLTQSTMALNAGVLAVVAYLGMANLAWVLVAATIQSSAFAFDNPSRQSMVPRLVPLPFMHSAISLQVAGFNGASVIGPLIAGLLYLPIGVPGLLAANALSFAAIIGALALLPSVPPLGRSHHSLLGAVAEGTRYLRANPVLVWIVTISGTVFIVTGPTPALLPAVAGESLFNGLSWLSLLLTAMGLGAFAGAVVVLMAGRFRSLGTIFVAAAMLSGVMLAAFALTLQPLVALAFIFLAGLGWTVMAGIGNNMLQATTADAYRGRVMSVWALLFIGVMPVGQLVLGALGSIFGIHASLALAGVIAFASGLYAALRVPALREWRRPAHRASVVAAEESATVPVGSPTFR